MPSEPTGGVLHFNRQHKNGFRPAPSSSTQEPLVPSALFQPLFFAVEFRVTICQFESFIKFFFCFPRRKLFISFPHLHQQPPDDRALPPQPPLPHVPWDQPHLSISGEKKVRSSPFTALVRDVIDGRTSNRAPAGKPEVPLRPERETG